MNSSFFEHLLWRATMAAPIGLFLSVLSIIHDAQQSVIAQVTTDRTLSTTVTSSDNLNFVINDGALRGTALFHSFEEFSVPSNGSAIFNNPINIKNIFSRVTGSRVSAIDGLIRTSGPTNLFLINPNGIIFGSNASLDIGGSFLATTADRILFENNQFFSATDTETTSLLTISAPTGLQFGTRQNPITVEGPGHNMTLDLDAFTPVQDNRPVGLEVRADHTLALVGGALGVEGGNLTAEQGRVELGSVAQAGPVSLQVVNNGFELDYGSIDTFGTIELTQAASIDVSGDGNGAIHIQAKTLDVLEASAGTNLSRDSLAR